MSIESPHPAYAAAIEKVVPQTYFDQAAEIVKRQRPSEPVLRDFNPVMMAVLVQASVFPKESDVSTQWPSCKFHNGGEGKYSVWDTIEVSVVATDEHETHIDGSYRLGNDWIQFSKDLNTSNPTVYLEAYHPVIEDRTVMTIMHSDQ